MGELLKFMQDLFISKNSVCSYRRDATGGFTVLYAMLVAGTLLSVGLVMFEISSKQISFATIVRDSNIAQYAADTGEECALYWDNNYSDEPSAFDAVSPTGVRCGGQDIVLAPSVIGNIKTITFTLNLTQRGGQGCTGVTVTKINSTPKVTRIESRGHNVCDSGANTIERTVQTSY